MIIRVCLNDFIDPSPALHTARGPVKSQRGGARSIDADSR
jgi:hypothetical protein